MSILIRNLYKVCAIDTHDTHTEAFTTLSAAQQWEKDLWDDGSCCMSTIYRAVAEDGNGEIKWEWVKTVT
jgi:hypothetical protein